MLDRLRNQQTNDYKTQVPTIWKAHMPVAWI